MLEAAAPLFTPLLIRTRLRSLAGGDVDDALRRREGGHALERPREVVSGFVDTVGHTDLRLPSPEAGEWNRIAAPVWILRGSEDRDWMPEAHEARYRELIPTARVIRWEGVGHAPQIAEPRRFGDLLDEFLAATR